MKSKNYLIIVLIMTLSIGGKAQITTLKASPEKTGIDSVAYDSSLNFVEDKAYQYIGQDLYLKPKESFYSNREYHDFFIDYTKNISESDGLYAYYGNIYKSDGTFKWSNHDSIAGKYFTCINIFEPLSKREYMPEIRKYLQLINKSNGDTVYYRYTTSSESLFPFIVVGFFEKQKSLLIGKDYVFPKFETEYYLKNTIKDTDIKFIVGRKWKCSDLFVDDDTKELSLLFNSNDIKAKIKYTDFIKIPKFTSAEVAKYQKKFGINTFNDILNGSIRIGMTKEMCKLSWGEPEDINKTITTHSSSEQWVYYGNRYVYFNGNTITAIQ